MGMPDQMCAPRGTTRTGPPPTPAVFSPPENFTGPSVTLFPSSFTAPPPSPPCLNPSTPPLRQRGPERGGYSPRPDLYELYRPARLGTPTRPVQRRQGTPWKGICTSCTEGVNSVPGADMYRTGGAGNVKAR